MQELSKSSDGTVDANEASRLQPLKRSWIEHPSIPGTMRPYLHLARADKQVGTALLFWPCLWSIALAAPTGSLPDMRMVLTFGAGAIIMRSAGCVINDIWDR